MTCLIMPNLVVSLLSWSVLHVHGGHLRVWSKPRTGEADKPSRLSPARFVRWTACPGTAPGMALLQPLSPLFVHLGTPEGICWGQSSQSGTGPRSHRVCVPGCVSPPTKRPMWSGQFGFGSKQTFPDTHWSTLGIRRLKGRRPPAPAFRSKNVLLPFFFFFF